MKVICAGVSKTGTKSVHVALEQLGYSVHDYLEALQYHVKDYCRFADEGWSVDEFRRMYEKVDAVVDTPTFYFWEELVEAFPDAKVILMVRDDVETWHRSMSKQIQMLNGSHLWFYYLFGSKGWKDFMDLFKKACGLPFGGFHSACFDPYFPFLNSLLAMQAYRRHVAHVTNTCPKDRLLIYNCKEGWEPLCKFLGKPVPPDPFPCINVNSELAAFIWKSEYFVQVTRRTRLKCAVTCIGLLAFAWLLKRKMFT